MTNKGRPEAALASDGEKLKSTVAVTTISVDEARRITEQIRSTALTTRESIEKPHVLVTQLTEIRSRLTDGGR